MPLKPLPRTDAPHPGAATLLARQLREGPSSAPATALDAFKLARRRFFAGERVDMSSIAAEIGVNRVTLYRWVGTREQLLTEVIWSLAQRTLDLERERATTTTGGERVAQIV